MDNHYKKFIEPITPFILVGIGIALCVALLFMFFYIAVWGFFIGGVLWIISLIKNYFTSKEAEKQHRGRIIEHNDNK